jgi:hypothetical protein
MTKHADLEGNEKLVVAHIAAGESTIMEIKPQLGKSQLETLSEIRSEPSMKSGTVRNKRLKRLAFLFDGRRPNAQSACQVVMSPNLLNFLLIFFSNSD